MATATGEYNITPAPFPARSKSASSNINGLDTTATSMSFADKILITVTQQGRLAHWVCLLSAHQRYLQANRYH